MFGVEPLARIVRHDARIEVKVPATQGRKAYSYFREGGEGEKKSSAMNHKKTAPSGMTAPVSEPKKVEKNNTARNAAIGAGVAGLGAAAAISITPKKGRKEDLSKYISESEPAIWTQALDNNADDSISVGGKEITDAKRRQGLVSAIYGSKAKTKKIKDLEKDGIGIRESKEYFVLELMRNATDNAGRERPWLWLARSPRKTRHANR